MPFAAVIFDFHGTLAHPAEGTTGYRQVLARGGYSIDDDAVKAWIESFDGADHRDHSTDETTYLAWSRHRLYALAEQAGVPAGARRDDVVAELAHWGNGPVVAYNEARDVLRSLRTAGVRLAICSNWGWHLDPFIEQAGLVDTVDVAVTSARAGARKPHPSIFAHTLDLLGVPAEETLFVGDNVRADVVGPLDAGFAAAVHVWRADRAQRGEAPGLPWERAHRTSDLTGVLDVVWS